MLSSNIFPVLSVLVALCNASPHVKRDDTTGVTLYAYGTGISSLPLVFGNTDGLVYISDGEDSANYSTLSWDISSDGTATWNATLANSTSTVGAFFITSGGSDFEGVGFTNDTSTLSINGTTLGIRLYGSEVTLIVKGVLESMFWAQTTDEEGIWALKWNSDGSSQTDSVPVVVKTIGT